jgi:CIC family chloride channel protein
MAHTRSSHVDPGAPTGREQDGILSLALLSVAVGVWTGLVVAMFRLGLAWADRLRGAFLAASHGWRGIGFAAVICAGAGAAALAAWLARRFSPYAAGSGIPEVETALQGELPPMPLARLLLVKFVGGLLALGGGMALGPEGPSVQMGAVGARLIGSRFRRRWPDTRSLVAAGTGAGLAVAFNAPIAGAVFVLEELHRHFNRREALAALGASSAAILVARLFLGHAPLFHIGAGPAPSAAGPLPYAAAATWPLYVALGVVAGLAGAVYNRTLIGALNLAERVDRWGVHPQAAAVGVLVGGIGWFAPHLIGGGETLTQGILVGAVAVGVVPFVFVLRFFFGAACYAVRAPGGLFAPLLLLGAQLGMLCGAVSRSAFPGLGIDPQAFAVIGMAAFFTGVVRAPITGIVLVIEMTAAFALLLPMLAASFAAMVAAALIGIPPIYRSLSERLRDRARVD